MNAESDISTLGALIGDPARSSMLDALMDGHALTGKELAYSGGITPQTASSHLAKLKAAGLIQLEKHGRNHYYRLANPQVAEALEAMMVLASHRKPIRPPASRALEEMRLARTCYDHLAGYLGVTLTTAMVAKRVLLPEEGGDFRVTESGADFFTKLGVDLAKARRRRRAFGRQCLDWSERRVHLAGALGAELASRCFGLGWIVRMEEGRAVRISPEGQRGFAETFGIEIGTGPQS